MNAAIPTHMPAMLPPERLSEESSMFAVLSGVERDVFSCEIVSKGVVFDGDVFDGDLLDGDTLGKTSEAFCVLSGAF